MNKMTKEEALKAIAELQKFVEEQDNPKKVHTAMIVEGAVFSNICRADGKVFYIVLSGRTRGEWVLAGYDGSPYSLHNLPPFKTIELVDFLNQGNYIKTAYQYKSLPTM